MAVLRLIIFLILSPKSCGLGFGSNSAAGKREKERKKRQDGWLDGTFNWLILRAKVGYSYFTNDNNEGKGQKVRHIRVRCVQGYT